MTLEELQVIIEANIKPFKDAMQQAQNEVKKSTDAMNNQVSKVKSIFSSLARTVAAIGIGKIFVDSVKSAMKVEASIQQINRIMGESTNAFLKWSKESALAFNMSQSDAMNFGAVFSNLVSGFSSGTEQTMQYTTDLLKASAVIASGTGRTMTDVMERIRSGLLGNTEAIEDLGVNVNVAMLQSTDAFKRFANGKSWDQLDFKTQQQIRLFGILEQTSSKFGSAVFNNTNSSLQQLVAILKDVALNLGNAFLPVLNVVLPILSNFAMGLRTVTGYVATFMQALFGKSSAVSPVVGATDAQTGYNSALADTGDTAKSTAKEMNRLLGGFDEINSLSDSGSSGAGAGGVDASSRFGGVNPGAIVEPDTSGIEAFANKVKDIFKPAIEAFGRLKETIKPFTDSIGTILLWLWDKILVPFATWTISELIPAFFDRLAGLFKVLNPILQSFMKLGSWLWDNFLEPIASWTGGVIVAELKAEADALSAIGDWMSDNQSVVDAITFSVAGFFAAWKVIELMAFIQMSGGVVGALTKITAAIKAGTVAKIVDKAETMYLTALYAKDFVMSIASGTVALVEQAAQFVKNTALKVADKAETIALSAMYAKDFVVSLASGTVELVKQAFQWTINTGLKVADTIATGAMTVATGIWNVVCGIATVVTWAFGAAVAFLTSPITLVILAIVALIAIGVLLYQNWDTVKEVASNVWAGIQEIFTNFDNWLSGVFATDWSNTFGAFGDILNGFFAAVSGIWNSIKQIFGGIIDFVVGVFTGNWSRAWEGIKNIFGGVFNGLIAIAKFPINCIIGLINGLITGIDWMIEKINGISLDLPDWLGGAHIGFDIPTIGKIPYLAKGGIVDSPTLSMVGEAGKEAVMPLENNTGWITQLAEKVATRMPQGGQGSNMTGDLILMIDGSVIGKVALAQLRKMQRQGGITLMPV